MRALITNDDGIDCVGLHLLARAAAGAGLDVIVAAPDGQRSGSGTAMSALAANGHLLVHERELDGLDKIRAVAVSASPAMIVFVALSGAFGPRPDIVLSGVNQGPNTGLGVLHSGTVGAALTAAARGVPAMAFSLASDMPGHWDTAGTVAAQAVDWFLPRATAPVTVNVNVPDLPAADVRGLRAARLATIGAVQAQIGEPGHGFIPVRYVRADHEPEPDSDVALLRQGWATVTALDGPRESAAFGLAAPAVIRSFAAD